MGVAAAACRYRVSAFYLSSAISDLPMDCALPALFVVIIYFMGGLRLTATAFLSNLTALVRDSMRQAQHGAQHGSPPAPGRGGRQDCDYVLQQAVAVVPCVICSSLDAREPVACLLLW
jgi:hypothetical protein